MYRYIYKITCTAGTFKDKFYFGQHTTANLDDNYKGSGTLLLNYYKKYPEDYIKEIISFHNTVDDLNKAEYEIIHAYLNNPMCLNLRDGGNMGEVSELTKQHLSESHQGQRAWNKGLHGIYSEQTLQRLADSARGNTNRRGKTHTEEAKRKMSESSKGQIPWNKGLQTPEDVKKKISMTKKLKISEHKK